VVLEYYKLQKQPFGVTPDTQYLFASETHREALASLLYGIETGRGFIALIAKPGMGKTTLLFRCLSQLQGKAKTVFLFQTISTPLDFLHALLADLGIQELQGGITELQAKLNDVLLEQSRRGERLVVVVDEAQKLDASVLELVRMLSNFETPREKLMQIILSGQPQLATKLASPDLVQLRQRISILARLRPFSREETTLYVDHRLRVAGYNSAVPLFTPAALQSIAAHSAGIPRNINNLCFNAMSLGCALKRRTIDLDIVREVVADLDLEPMMEKGRVVAARRAGRVLAIARARMPILGAWLSKAAVVIVASSVLALLAMQRYRVTASTDVVHASPVMPHLLMPPPHAAGRHVPPVVAPFFDAAPGPRADRIRVKPGLSLYQICIDRFGSCDSEELNEIHRLNPWLRNTNQIKSGQVILIPARRSRSAVTSAGLAMEAATQ
jgi:type II secretory pathway predicted ATPase ExeA